jgi:hypothetical protein
VKKKLVSSFSNSNKTNLVMNCGFAVLLNKFLLLDNVTNEVLSQSIRVDLLQESVKGKQFQSVDYQLDD